LDFHEVSSLQGSFRLKFCVHFSSLHAYIMSFSSHPPWVNHPNSF
jgi:hypothetical protein